MEFFNNSLSIIENIYYFCAPLIVIIGVFGLQQLRIAKKSIRITASRAAATLAFNLCEKYSKIFHDQYIEIGRKCKVEKMKHDVLMKMNLKSIDIMEEDHQSYMEWKKVYDSLDQYEYDFFLLANSLERFSTPFINKLAHEKYAFDHLAPVFIESANLCSVYITKCRSEKDASNMVFENTIKLYRIWRDRYEYSRLSEKEGEIKISKLQLIKQSISPHGAE